MKKIWYMYYNGISFSHKKKEIMSFAEKKKMELEIIMLSKVSQTHKGK
jgi:hypothetical protein